MKAALVGLIALTLTGCSSLDRQLKQAATVQGVAQARVTLPAYPEDCRTKEPHAELNEGTEIRSILKRERDALDRQNARTDRCAGFYDELARGMK
ncbi:hypothetical protein FHW00_001311 [Ochrobactrum sp. P6BSIII]|uniref:hypothetical protein n=1 Tax=Ochrobactrum sp. P6BS-III TaxID=1920636 RepID=UPI0018392940|nr:hypothetical protein [Ochrobactrum sp. P6BSIII]